MSVARTVGHPDYTQSGTSNFIPQYWSGNLQVKWYNATCLPEICNSDYEGEIKDSGDKVYIRTVPSVTVNTYTKGLALSYEHLEQADLELDIDKGKYFAFAIDDVDKFQSDLALMDKWSTDASQQMKISIETGFWSDSAIYAGMATYNTGATAGYKSNSFNLGASTAPVQVTKTNIIDYLVDCGTCLDEYDVPRTDRWFVMPMWMSGLIDKSDLKDASMTGESSSPLLNGRIGRVADFTIYRSNTLYSLTDTVVCTYAMFGHKAALTFASQISKVQHIPISETSFQEKMRGLNVYGYKPVKPEGYGTLYCRQ